MSITREEARVALAVLDRIQTRSLPALKAELRAITGQPLFPDAVYQIPDRPLMELERLPARARQLERFGVYSLHLLAIQSREWLESLVGIGATTIQQIEAVMVHSGLRLPTAAELDIWFPSIIHSLRNEEGNSYIQDIRRLPNCCRTLLKLSQTTEEQLQAAYNYYENQCLPGCILREKREESDWLSLRNDCKQFLMNHGYELLTLEELRQRNGARG